MDTELSYKFSLLSIKNLYMSYCYFCNKNLCICSKIIRIQKFLKNIKKYENNLLVINCYIFKNYIISKQNDLIINMTNIIQDKFKKLNGSGLSSGMLIENVLLEFLTSKYRYIKKYNVNEADLTIFDHSFSFKKITGKSCIALNWSKNLKENNKKYFICDIIIFVVNTSKWWKNKIEDIDYTKTIKSGFYFVSKYFCSKNIKLSSNNKSNSIIDSKNLYKILLNSIDNNMFVEIKNNNVKIYEDYSFINGFI